MESSPYTQRVIHPKNGSPVPMLDSAKTKVYAKSGQPKKRTPHPRRRILKATVVAQPLLSISLFYDILLYNSGKVKFKYIAALNFGNY